MGAPRVVRCAGNTQDERHPAPGQHRARRPDDRPAGAERDRQLEDGAREDRGEDLRHADLEPEPDLSEDVDRDDDGGDVQPGVAGVRQDHGVRTAAERQRRTAHSPGVLIAPPGSTVPHRRPRARRRRTCRRRPASMGRRRRRATARAPPPVRRRRARRGSNRAARRRAHRRP